jgi:hypothetical protein
MMYGLGGPMVGWGGSLLGGLWLLALWVLPIIWTIVGIQAIIWLWRHLK